MVGASWQVLRNELQLFLDKLAESIIQSVPETHMLTVPDIESLLIRTIPQVPWNKTQYHGALYETAFTSHTKFYAAELHKRFQAASFDTTNQKTTPSNKKFTGINLLTSDGAAKALEDLSSLDDNTRSALFLSKSISPSLLTLAYNKECELKKNKSGGDQEIILQWAKRVCNLQLADDQDLVGSIKVFLHIVLPLVSEIESGKTTEATKVLSYQSKNHKDSYEIEGLLTTLLACLVRTAAWLDAPTSDSSLRASKDYALIVSLLGERTTAHMEKLITILYTVSILSLVVIGKGKMTMEDIKKAPESRNKAENGLQQRLVTHLAHLITHAGAPTSESAWLRLLVVCKRAVSRCERYSMMSALREVKLVVSGLTAPGDLIEWLEQPSNIKQYKIQTEEQLKSQSEEVLCAILVDLSPDELDAGGAVFFEDKLKGTAEEELLEQLVEQQDQSEESGEGEENDAEGDSDEEGEEAEQSYEGEEQYQAWQSGEVEQSYEGEEQYQAWQSGGGEAEDQAEQSDEGEEEEGDEEEEEEEEEEQADVDMVTTTEKRQRETDMDELDSKRTRVDTQERKSLDHESENKKLRTSDESNGFVKASELQSMREKQTNADSGKTPQSSSAKLQPPSSKKTPSHNNKTPSSSKSTLATTPQSRDQYSDENVETYSLTQEDVTQDLNSIFKKMGKKTKENGLGEVDAENEVEALEAELEEEAIRAEAEEEEQADILEAQLEEEVDKNEAMEEEAADKVDFSNGTTGVDNEDEEKEEEDTKKEDGNEEESEEDNEEESEEDNEEEIVTQNQKVPTPSRKMAPSPSKNKISSPSPQSPAPRTTRAAAAKTPQPSRMSTRSSQTPHPPRTAAPLQTLTTRKPRKTEAEILVIPTRSTRKAKKEEESSSPAKSTRKGKAEQEVAPRRSARLHKD